MSIAKLLKGFFIAVGLCVAAVISIYLLLVVINLKDEPASTLVKSLQAEMAQEKPVPDADNGWVYTLGFSAPRHDSPEALGALRASWIRQSLRRPATLDPDQDPGAAIHSLLPAQGEDSALLDACSRSDTDCLLAISASPPVLADLLVRQRWIIQRYETLISHGEWQEASPMDIMAPLPPFADVLNAQKLYFLQAISDAKASPALLRETFARDARFWLQVALNSDVLITRIMATKALERNLRFLNLAARSRPDIGTESLLPEIWAAPLDASCFSMRRAFMGEWKFADRLLWQMKSGDPGLLETDSWDTSTWTSYSLNQLQRPLLQPQYSSNQQAAVLMQLADIVDTGHANYTPVIAQAYNFENARLQEIYAPRLYNIALRMGTHEREPQFYRYGARMLDIEGLRRGIIAIMELRAAGTTSAALPAALMAHPLTANYLNGSFYWDGARGVVVFTGQAEGEQGKHKLVY